MKKLVLPFLASLALQGCVVHAPTVSSNLIEANETKGNIIQITGSHCHGSCERMAILKAQELCPGGYFTSTPAIPTFAASA